MTSPSIFKSVLHRASVMTGALFCLALALVSSSCGEERRTPDWGKDKTEVEREPQREPSAPNKAKPRVSKARSETRSGGRLRFMSYNLENWLTMERSTPGGSKGMAPKPESEKKAVIDLIIDQQPDVLGLAEIGTEADLADIQRRLKAEGLDLSVSHLTSGTDPVRRVGLLSRFPIVATAKPKATTFELQGRTYGINRGILDVTIEQGQTRYRFLGVHLKSKRDVPEVNEEQMRIHEAELLRRHVDEILKSDADARLVVFGDFNDSRNSMAIKTVMGSYGGQNSLMPIRLRDSRGHAWTHCWDYEDIYSRLDYVAVSDALKSEVDYKGSCVIDDPAWEKASDHRPLLVIFR